MERVIYPYQYPERDDLVLFLGGPIGGARRWQDNAIKIIHNLAPDIVIATPRRPGDPLEAQEEWEFDLLDRASERGGILFYLAKQEVVIPGRSYAQTSRSEVAWWMNEYRHNPSIILVIGAEGGFTGLTNLKARAQRYVPGILPLATTLEETCQRTVNLIRKNFV